MLSSSASWLAVGAESGLVSNLDVFLGRSADEEGWDVDSLFADLDVTLSDPNTSLVDRFGSVVFGDDGLESTLEDVFDAQSEDVIELVFVLVKNAEEVQTTQKSVTFELALLIGWLEGQQLTSGASDLTKHEFSTVDFSLAAETVLTNELKLAQDTGRNVWASWGIIGLGEVSMSRDGWHSKEKMWKI